MRKYDGVWVFNGDDGRFAGGIFTTQEAAEAWIADNKLDGVLTLYPVDTGVHEWAISRGLFYTEAGNALVPGIHRKLHDRFDASPPLRFDQPMSSPQGRPPRPLS